MSEVAAEREGAIQPRTGLPVGQSAVGGDAVEQVLVEWAAGDHQVRRLREPGQGGADGGDVLVGPPAAGQAHRRGGLRDAQRGAGAVPLGPGEPVTVVDRAGPHPPGHAREGAGEPIPYGCRRVQRDHLPLASEGEPAERPYRRVLRGDGLVDEPQVGLPAEEGGGAVQGLARAEQHHRGRLSCEAPGAPQAGGPRG
ncbi:hypothetical protein M1P56_12785 [Streptomyces sp. HU2014]|uniref:hypothetical protein n=1 Tax=Streptomyces sp. HU2014 TaxID=2939414 RepID=UPI00200EAAE3|nr:hypothetical protein [Streptomyces sp. HU2014]UQI45160.1 hypothetical protein M1P56_12785 [Streptomyces sp. HU2014]